MSDPGRTLRLAAGRAAIELLIVAEEAGDLINGAERDALSKVRWFCQEIEDGER